MILNQKILFMEDPTNFKMAAKIQNGRQFSLVLGKFDHIHPAYMYILPIMPHTNDTKPKTIVLGRSYKCQNGHQNSKWPPFGLKIKFFCLNCQLFCKISHYLQILYTYITIQHAEKYILLLLSN